MGSLFFIFGVSCPQTVYYVIINQERANQNEIPSDNRTQQSGQNHQNNPRRRKRTIHIQLRTRIHPQRIAKARHSATQKGNGNQSRTSSLRTSQQHDRLLHSPIHSLKGQAMKKTDGFVAILFIFGFILTANEDMNFINIIGIACVFSALYIYRKGAKK